MNQTNLPHLIKLDPDKKMAMVRRSFALSLLAAFLAVLHRAASAAPAAPSPDTASFLRCLAADLPPQVVHTNASPSYASVLESSIKNLLFVTPATPTPVAIVAAADASHVQAAVRCGARHGVRVRPRSGGHDYEGLSYRSLSAARPFAVVDLAALRAVRVDAGRRTAWVGSGATLGELYYAIANRSARLGFPGGVGPTVGVGGHLSGGGFGLLLRKHGLAADHVVDAVIVDAEGRLLDRVAMGEDLFWAIRGGGGGSFGIVLRWKLRLVRLPATVAVFTVHRARNQSATALLARWQRVAPALPRDVFLRVVLQNQDAQFQSLYLGTCAGLDLVPLDLLRVQSNPNFPFSIPSIAAWRRLIFPPLIEDLDWLPAFVSNVRTRPPPPPPPTPYRTGKDARKEIANRIPSPFLAAFLLFILPPSLHRRISSC